MAQLKGKVYNEAMLQDEGFSAAEKEEAASLSEMQQLAVAGLVRLGYKQNEAAGWVEAVSTNGDGEPLDAEEIIRAVFAQRNEEIG